MVFLERQIRIDPPTFGSWQTVDLSDFIPVTARGVILCTRCSSTQTYGVRNFGSTDDLKVGIYSGSGEMFYIGCTNRKIEIYEGAQQFVTNLMGYMDEASIMSTNSTYFPGVTLADGWVEFDLSAVIPYAAAVGAYFIKCSANTYPAPKFGVRKFGSSYDQKSFCNEIFGFIAPLSNRKCEIYLSSAKESNFYFVGYLKSGVFKDVPEEVTPTAGSWQTIDRISDVDLPSDSTGIIYHIFKDSPWGSGTLRERPQGTYSYHNVLGTDGNVYYCTKSHVSSASTRPITGVSYSTYWTSSGVPDTYEKTWAWQNGYSYEGWIGEPIFENTNTHGSSIEVCGLRSTLGATVEGNGAPIGSYGTFLDSANGDWYFIDYLDDLGKICKINGNGTSPWQSGEQEIIYFLTDGTIITSGTSFEGSTTKLIDAKNFTVFGVTTNNRIYRTDNGTSARITSITTTYTANDTLNFVQHTGFPWDVSPDFSTSAPYEVKRHEQVLRMADDTNQTDGFFCVGLNSWPTQIYRVNKDGSGQDTWVSDAEAGGWGFCFDPFNDRVVAHTVWTNGFNAWNRGLPHTKVSWVPADGGGFRGNPFVFADGRFGYNNWSQNAWILFSGWNGVEIQRKMPLPNMAYGWSSVDDANNRVYLWPYGGVIVYCWDIATNTMTSFELFGTAANLRQGCYNPNDGYAYTPNFGNEIWYRNNFDTGLAESWNGDSGGYGYTSQGGTYFVPGNKHVFQAYRVNTDVKIWILGYTQSYPGIIPEIGLSTNVINATCYLSEDAAPTSFTISNTGEGFSTLNYIVYEDSFGWLGCVPGSGSIYRTDPAETITVNFYTSLLPVGVYTAHITVTDPLADNDPQYITINLTILPPDMGSRMRQGKFFVGQHYGGYYLPS